MRTSSNIAAYLAFALPDRGAKFRVKANDRPARTSSGGTSGLVGSTLFAPRMKLESSRAELITRRFLKANDGVVGLGVARSGTRPDES
jgi:hypothetical protein